MESNGDPAFHLGRIVDELGPGLATRGFHYEAGDVGVSSGGPFATGFFSRPPFRIGLVVRGETLGAPVYEWGPALSSHDGLVRALDRRDEAHLRWDPDKWTIVARDGIDVLRALVLDLETIILPSLERSPDDFRRAVESGHAEFLRRLHTSSEPS